MVTTLAEGERVLLFKDDGSVVVHAAAGAKPINYMPGPTVVREDGRTLTVHRPDSGELLTVEVIDVHADTTWPLVDTAKIVREGREKDIQATIFASPDSIEPGMVGLERESFTEVGPVDLLCRDVEVKRVRATAAAVEQLTRYVQQVDRNAGHAPARGMLVAPDLAPQARVLLEDRGFDFVALEEVLSRCSDDVELMRLF